MKKRIAVILFVLILSLMLGTGRITTVRASTHHVHAGESIQEAINSVQSGDTIFVHNGTYYENFVVNKSVSLIGEDKYNTVVEPDREGNVIEVTVDNVTIMDFTIRNGWISTEIDSGNIALNNVSKCKICENQIMKDMPNPFLWGILLENSSNNNITGNNVIGGFNSGIYLHSSSNNTVSGNYVACGPGNIYLKDSSNNTIYGNRLTASWTFGIDLSWSSDYNSICGNDITNNYLWGIGLTQSSNNTISGNNITKNGYGVRTQISSNNNKFYHNNFINNTQQVNSDTSPNVWDDGYPSGGNYWSNYTGVDSNHDGIGDTQHIINENNKDRYPLMNPWITTETSVQVEGKHYPVVIVSNTTISQVTVTQNTLSFNSSGTTGEK